MKNVIPLLGGVLLSLFLLISCNNSSGSRINEITDFKQLVQEWNNAHLSKDVGVFSNLFGSSVLFYGTQQGKNECIESKLSLFKKYPDFYQQIFGDIQTEKVTDTEVKLSFVKRVTTSFATKDYPSYLTFRKIGDSWKIVTEGDLVTDMNLAKKNTTTKPLSTTSTTVKDEKNRTTTTPPAGFITGLTASKVYTKDQAENGSEFHYSDDRRFKIKFFYEQVDVLFYAYNESNQKQRIMTEFGVGYISPNEEEQELKKGTNYLVGQYDFNADDIDELVIAVQDNDEGDNGVSVNVFQLSGDTWEQLGAFTGKMIAGVPTAEVKMNKITIPRKYRDFYYQWTFESGKFKNTSDF